MAARISVLIVNYNGKALLADCLAALGQQTFSASEMEIIVGDNGSSDDSVSYLRTTFPQVKVVEAGRNLGFAGGNNLAARHATGEWLALINNDAIAAPDWLERMLASAEQQQVACVAAKMLNGDGTKIDFGGGVMNLWGRAFAPEEGWPASTKDEPREIFFACGGAMLIRRDVFLSLGGFDDAFVAYFEDVDLGWRLRLAGHRVWYDPTATVRHLGSTTGKRFPVEQRYTLSEGNALRSLIKNYGEATLNKVLPLSLFLMSQRALRQGNVDADTYQFGVARSAAEPMGDESEPAMTRIATGIVVAMAEVADDLPRVMAQRAQIQATRVVDDETLFAQFPLRLENYLFPWRETVLTQAHLINALEIPAVLQPQYGSRLLIITHEKIGPRMAGPAIRAWEMAHALAGQFTVAIACNGTPERQSDTVQLLPYDAQDRNSRELAQYVAGADVVLTMGTLVSRLPLLHGLNKPLIVDLYDPFELEKLAQLHTVEAAHHATVDDESEYDVAMQSRAGDFYICASERQRDLWLGTLLGAGRLNHHTYAADHDFRTLIDVVPFGISATPPRHDAPVLKGIHPAIQPDDKVLLWGGGLWEWFDPLTLLEAVAQLVPTYSNLKLYFAAGSHFDASVVPTMPILAQVRERAAALGILDTHVLFGDWIPYDARGAYLVEADVGVSTHKTGIESRFASRTRLLDYVWTGLPILTTGGDPIAEEVRQRGVGRVVPPNDVAAVAKALQELLQPNIREQFAPAFAAWRDELRWEKVVAPITRFLHSPHLAPDAAQSLKEVRLLDRLRAAQTVQAFQAQQMEEAKAYIQELEQHLDTIRNGRVMKLLSRFGKQ